ncbi:F-BOX WITH WD-40 2 isoform X2 [Wolffia australiana]
MHRRSCFLCLRLSLPSPARIDNLVSFDLLHFFFLESKSCRGGGMDGGSDIRRWDEMIPDALGLIFSNLSLQDVLTVVPRVCKSWGAAVAGPYCWQELDIEEWCERSRPELIARMLRLLIPRSSGSIRRLSVSSLPGDHLLRYIAKHGSSLQALEMPRSEISDAVVEEVAAKLTNLTFLDLSYCVKMGAPALAAFGRHCKSLVGLKRVMHPVEVAEKTCQDDEAHAIAATMPQLRHIEIAYLLLTNKGILDILTQCRDLQFLDMRGCWDVKLKENFLKEKYAGLKVLGPLIVDSYEMNYWDEYSNYSDSSGYLSWEEFADDVELEFFDGFGHGDNDDGADDDGAWDAGRDLEGLQVRFYGAGFDVAGSDWPPSP